MDDTAVPGARLDLGLPIAVGGDGCVELVGPHRRRRRVFWLVTGVLWSLPVVISVVLVADAAPAGPRSILLLLLAVPPVAALALVLWPPRARADQSLPQLEGADTIGIRARLRHDEATLHRVRSMVAGISLATQVLDGESVRSVSRVTRANLQDMQRQEIHRLARLLCDEQPDASRTVAVDLDHVLEPLVVAVRARGTQVWWQHSGGLAAGRPDEVAEVVQVLLENAERHATGSPVTLEVTRSDDAVVVRVSDDGPGVALPDADRIFDWGVRAAGSPGQGIGLSAARDQARRLGGDLSCEPSRSGGASFELRLPPTAQADGGCSGPGPDPAR